MNHQKLHWVWALGLIMLFAGCGRPSGRQSATAADGEKPRVLCWVQPLKGHPVHQLTQLAFREACNNLGYECLIIGTDSWDIGGTVALAEQALAGGNVAGMAVWTGSPAFNPLIERVGRAGVPVILPHFPAAEGSVPGATGIIGCNPEAYAQEAAIEIGRAIGGQGSVAVTQGGFNELENLVAEVFARTLRENYPEVKVLPAEEEGYDAPKAIARCVSLMQAHPTLRAAFSTTGGGPVAWAGAQKETRRRIVAIGMDYTRVNLDLVKNGEVHAVIGQPLWDEAYGAAELLDRAIRGEKIPWWTELPAPLITKGRLAPYYAILDKVEAVLK